MATAFEGRGTVSVIPGNGLTVHSYLSPADGDLVCSDIVETANRVIIVDAQLLLPYAREVRDYATRLGKPIDRVLVTHSHPDHFSGLEVFADLPIHAGQGTVYALATWGKGIMDFKRQTLGERASQYASSLPLPSVTGAPGSETVDGVELVFAPVYNSEQAEIMTVEIPSERLLIAADVVYNGVHPVVGDKNPQRERMFDGWVAALQSLQSRDIARIVPGHGKPTDLASIPPMIEYIQFTKQLFESGVPEGEFRNQVLARYPGLGGQELVEYSVVFLYHSDW